MLTGALPTGLNFNAGLLSGTPTQTGTFPLVASVSDSVGGTASANYSLQINAAPPPALVLQTNSLPSGEAGAPYNTPLSATGGVPPYSWSVSGLPEGLKVNQNTGIISGTLAPDATTSTNVVLTVTDRTNTSASSLPLTLTVTPRPSITSSSPLPNAEATAPYSQTLTATGGTAPFTWTVTDGSLPVGLSLNPTSGTISGTPTTTGSFNFTVTLTDSLGVSAPPKNFKLKVTGGLGITTPSPLPQGEVTIPYSQTLTASGGTNSGFTWAITSGSPPANLSLSAGGVLSGTPTAAGPSNFTVQVTDSGGGNATKSFSLTIIAALTITSNPTLPQGEVGAAYSQTLTATGGQAPHVYTWSVISGSLPAGLALTAGGVLSGTPRSAALGTASFTVQATDSAGGTATLPMSLTIIPGPTITTAPTLPNGTVGGTYTTTLAASDGTKPYIWSITLGVLPAGLSLDANAGTISGTPKATGASNFTVQVIDAKGVTATKQFSITISGGLTITTAPGLRNASIGLAYSATLSAAGGTPPYTWIVNSGSLPTGLTLNSSTGAISGLPSISGSFKFTVQVTDSASGTATKLFTLNVTQTLVITTAPTLPSGAVGTPYLQSLSAVGGTQPYIFTVVSGVLPNSVNLSPGGVISGTPASSGTFNFTIQVRDSNLVTASQPFSLTVLSSLSITTATQLPQGAINSQYSQPIAATGGTGTYTWNLAQGALPPGVTLSVAGVIAGKPSSTGTFTFTIQVTDQAGGTSNKQFTLTIVAGLTITSGAVLPPGTIGVAYPALTLAEVGGNFPYTWSVSSGSLAPGLLLSSKGVVTGTPTKAGAFSFTLQVKDSVGATATQAFTISVVPPTVPEVNIAGVPPTSPAGQQISFSVSLASPYPLDITGDITLSFQPDAVAPAVDPALQFSSGGTTASFTIPANSTDPVPMALQTGTVSGTLTLTFALTAGGAELPGFQSTITIPRSAPVIQSVKLVRTSAGMEIHVVGFSPSRDLTEADLTFTAAAGSSLQTTSVTEKLTSVATAWYQSAGSAQYGSQLMLVLPFTASQGSVDAVGGVSVVLKNAKGSSPSASGTF